MIAKQSLYCLSKARSNTTELCLDYGNYSAKCCHVYIINNDKNAAYPCIPSTLNINVPFRRYEIRFPSLSLYFYLQLKKIPSVPIDFPEKEDIHPLQRSAHITISESPQTFFYSVWGFVLQHVFP